MEQPEGCQPVVNRYAAIQDCEPKYCPSNYDGNPGDHPPCSCERRHDKSQHGQKCQTNRWTGHRLGRIGADPQIFFGGLIS
jgi:hypothetical protein